MTPSQVAHIMSLVGQLVGSRPTVEQVRKLSEINACVCDLAPQQAEPVAWRWKERDRFFNWTTDWEHHDKAKAMGCEIEYATPSAPTAEPDEREPMTKDELDMLAKGMCDRGELVWAGFRQDAKGFYTIPNTSPNMLKLVNAARASKGTK